MFALCPPFSAIAMLTMLTAMETCTTNSILQHSSTTMLQRFARDSLAPVRDPSAPIWLPAPPTMLQRFARDSSAPVRDPSAPIWLPAPPRDPWCGECEASTQKR